MSRVASEPTIGPETPLLALRGGAGGGVLADPPWAATADEIIGPLGAGPDARGHFRVGGDLLVSRDALASLEASLPATPDEALGPLVDATLGAPHVALEGVRSLTSIRDVILAARAQSSTAPR